MTTFADLYKPVKDFFGKVYVSDNRIDIAGRADKAKVSAFLEQKKDSATGELVVENELNLVNDTQTKYKFTLTTSGRAIAKLTVGPQIKGLELNAQADMAIDASGDNYEVSADYKADPLTLTSAVKVTPKKTVIDASTSLNVKALKGLTVGGNMTYNPESSVEKFAYGAQYKQANATLAFNVEDQKKIKTGVTVATKNGNTPVTIGAEIVQNLTSSPPVESLTAGVQTVLSGQTVKAKLNNKGAFGLALQTALGSGFKATWGMQTNMNKLDTFGAAVKIEYEG